MKAGMPPSLPKGKRRCPLLSGNFKAGRSILPAVSCFWKGSAAAVALAATAAANDAGVWPAEKEQRPDMALRPDGAQKARAMALYLNAARTLETKGAKAALPLFKEIMPLVPGDSALASRVASLAAEAGLPNEARRMLEDAVNRNPEAEGPAVALAKFIIGSQQDGVQGYAEALDLVRKLQVKFPGSAEVCALTVRLAVSDQRRDEAQSAVRQAIARGSQRPDFWLRMSGIAREAFPLDDPDTHTAHFGIVSGCIEKAVALAPEDTGVLESAAEFYAGLKMQEKACRHYRKLTALQPGNLPARRKLGQILRVTGDTAGAQRLFQELLQIDDSDPAAHRVLAAIHEAAGRREEALRHRSELLRIEGGPAEDYLKMAAQLAEAGLNDERRLTLERGFFKHPQSPRLAVALGGALHRAGKLKEATAVYEKAVLLASQHDPDALDDAYYTARAECARDAGERGSAGIHFRKAIDKTPKGKPERAVPAYTGLAMLWLDEGDKLEEARELLRLAESLRKDDPAVARALALYEQKKKLRDAGQSVEKSPP